jgi:hypothetical protein
LGLVGANASFLREKPRFWRENKPPASIWRPRKGWDRKKIDGFQNFIEETGVPAEPKHHKPS